MIEAGVKVEACKACAEEYDAVGVLSDLGVNVRYMGVPLTNYIKSGEHVLSI